MPVPGRPEEIDGLGIDAVTITRLWENPCWFAFRFNYLALRYNIPLYGWVEREYGLLRPQFAVIYSLGLRDNVTARDIGISFGFPKNTLSRAIRSLEVAMPPPLGGWVAVTHRTWVTSPSPRLPIPTGRCPGPR